MFTCMRGRKAHGLSPHRWRQFKLSNDPAFAAKLHDVVGLYVSPPAHVLPGRRCMASLRGLWCCRWMKSRKFRHLIGPNRACR